MIKKMLWSLLLLAATQVQAKEILFIGNSITLHAPKQSIGWNGNWGMAASGANTDYAARLAAYLKQAESAADFNITRINLSGIEREAAYQFDIKTVQRLANHYDYIVIFLGDNVSVKNNQNLTDFSSNLEQLLARLPRDDASVIFVSTWWSSATVDRLLKKLSTLNGACFVDISGLSAHPEFTASFSSPQVNPDVGKHPSDAGMDQIARKIAKQLSIIK
ncbi:SGNH/GDSL hydrolase family protein [Methylophilus aquaticus]|uniref:SGNH/GDSL hydrolase family protein n=1 Tax=Methylophilus aquaticus TaxID=1971610 RepID=A0ABT9JT78_9PROT|nr:SGNH/GDSL hydrolase family protein [Methylophilus aquaticus]MDP8567783.1 SGNH/GDSL hydrolase family protein [Methylophilus aquaticus]